jgi:hypothetical protein
MKFLFILGCSTCHLCSLIILVSALDSDDWAHAFTAEAALKIPP